MPSEKWHQFWHEGEQTQLPAVRRDQGLQPPPPPLVELQAQLELLRLPPPAEMGALQAGSLVETKAGGDAQ